MISEVYKDPRVVKNRKVQNLEALNHFSTVVIRFYCMEKITRKWLCWATQKLLLRCRMGNSYVGISKILFW